MGAWSGEERRGEDLLAVPRRRLREVRGAEIGMVFQDPLSALNPVRRVGGQIAEVLRVHEGLGRRAALERAIALLESVGMPDPAQRASMYPHELSGGMQQRVMIAMAMACRPALLIADEPTTALDVTVQAQVVEVLLRAKQESDTAIVLITHDLGLVAGVADRVVVMYAGRVVEQANVDRLFEFPTPPYTTGLLRSVPDPGWPDRRPVPIRGNPPASNGLPRGCAFRPRCDDPNLGEACGAEEPPLLDIGGPGHRSACHFAAAATQRRVELRDRPTP